MRISWSAADSRQSYNLIAQKNNEINMTIAKLQSHDSRMVKGIAILTLLFLPSTLIAVCSLFTAPVELHGPLGCQ